MSRLSMPTAGLINQISSMINKKIASSWPVSNHWTAAL